MGADFVELDWVWDAQGQGWICHSMALEQHFPEQQGFLDQLPTQAVANLRGFLGKPLLSLEDAIRYYGHREVNLEIKASKGASANGSVFSNKPAPNIGLQTGGYLVLIRSIYSKQRTVGRIYNWLCYRRNGRVRESIFRPQPLSERCSGLGCLGGAS